ncbi:MAG: hypothetical protein ACK4PG_03050 [Acetobacteraceae bacterium]
MAARIGWPDPGMETGAQTMTRPLWPLALAFWLGATPAPAEAPPAERVDRMASPRPAGSDGDMTTAADRPAARQAAKRPALRAERRGAPADAREPGTPEA